MTIRLFQPSGMGAPRCDYQPGRLRCVRRSHPEHPNAHVRVAPRLVHLAVHRNPEHTTDLLPVAS
jgi:hypothetical protein